MRLVTVRALKAFTHDGHTFRVGESVTFDAGVLSALARRGLVSLTRDYRPTYQTRDMVAAPVVAAVEVEAPRRRRRRHTETESA